MYLTTHTHTLHRRCILTRKETQHTHTQLGKKKSKQRINFNYMLKIHKLFWVERESDAELTANVHLWRRSEGDFDRKWWKITLERGMGNPFFYAASHIGIFLFLRCFFSFMNDVGNAQQYVRHIRVYSKQKDRWIKRWPLIRFKMLFHRSFLALVTVFSHSTNFFSCAPGCELVKQRRN